MRRLVLGLLGLSALAVVLLVMGGAASSGGEEHRPLHDAATGELRPAKLTEQVQQDGQTTTVTKTAPFFSAGTVTAVEDALGAGAADQALAAADGVSSPVDLGSVDLGESEGTAGCHKRDGHGTRRVNQDCTFRRQAEEEITFNPADPKSLLAGQNDSRVGFNQCGIDWSTDSGRHWGDLLPPFRQKVNRPDLQLPTADDPNQHTVKGDPGTDHTYDVGSDPSVAFDSQGRAFFSCVIFDVNTDASAVFVASSPKGANGAFFFNIASLGRKFIVAEDNSPAASHDKEFIVADTYAGSPNRDNVYVTWTVFNFTCGSAGDEYCSSPIFGSMSTDHGQTWSTPEEISGTSSELCFFGDLFDPNRDPHACDFDQGSDPIVLPNGDLEAVFNNGNTPADNPNAQQLGVHCRPSGSSPAGTARLNCGAPTKAGDAVVLGEPLCDFGRGPEECIPGAAIRTNEFPRIAVTTDNGNVYATWQDYRNGEWDIQLARSTDGGLTWSESVTVNPDDGLDHYFPAIDISEKGEKDGVGVSYYRTERVPDENTPPADGSFDPGDEPGVGEKSSDYVLAGGGNLDAPFDFKVVSPVFPPPDGIQAGFNGDYSGLTIPEGDEAHPIWSDTRNADPFAPANGITRDEDVFTDKVGLPSGKGKPGPGTIGQN